MQLTYLGHSTVYIDTGKYKLIIDPFLTGNPSAERQADSIEADFILLTHGHSDHIGDAEAIARKNNAPIIAMVELADYYAAKGLETVGMNLGGSKQFPFGRVEFTPALHSTSIVENGTNVYLGVAAGILIDLDGTVVYHAGDTALFSDMKLIGRRKGVDLAILPIGDFYTMGPEDALLAAEWIGAKHVLPVHYNTFPPIGQDGAAFVRELAKSGITGHELKPGESLDLSSL
ncbi:metal-dependent hydrolase [Paenibacillus sp. CAA11]|uniref:metal-dependent hydrolase n=1 Tax=Paenibacillus sp. CAA11 TaxID=1532905 RepID=UPI000D3D0F81|nr:metal-dependent hydrolase [Paenibacillus sp. CAA11]AWB44473.1 metal-dependent hydrolase [Paenibacillus sp. CAA11]